MRSITGSKPGCLSLPYGSSLLTGTSSIVKITAKLRPLKKPIFKQVIKWLRNFILRSFTDLEKRISYTLNYASL